MNCRNDVLQKVKDYTDEGLSLLKNKLFNTSSNNFPGTESMKQILTKVAITQAGYKLAILISVNDFEICLEKVQTHF